MRKLIKKPKKCENVVILWNWSQIGRFCPWHFVENAYNGRSCTK